MIRYALVTLSGLVFILGIGHMTRSRGWEIVASAFLLFLVAIRKRE